MREFWPEEPHKEELDGWGKRRFPGGELLDLTAAPDPLRVERVAL